MTCDKERLRELTDQGQREVGNPLSAPGPEREIYINNYADALLACNPHLVEQAKNNPDSESLGAIEAGISEPLNIDKNDPILVDFREAILNSLAQTGEGKRAVNGESSKEQTADLGADPVMLFKGQFVHEASDIHINGAGIDFVFKRTYKNQVLFNGPLGYNWTHNFHIWLRVGDQVIFRSTGDLREEPFTKHPKFQPNSDGDFDYWIPPDGKNSIIRRAFDGTFFLRMPNGVKHIFEQDPAHPFLHRLKKIEDRHGNYLALTYDQQDRLGQIEVNHQRRIVAFEYDSQNRICLIRDYTGRQWHYTYDSSGDLIAVTTPTTDRYKHGLTVCYEYSSAYYTGELQHNLTRIIDASGQMYLENEYGTSAGLLNFNRVVRQRQGGGEYRFEYEDIDQVFDFDYPDHQRPAHQTILVERNGQPVRHVYNKFGNLLLREQHIMEQGLPRTLTEHYRYNRDGNVVASLSPEGVLTQTLYGRDYFIRQHPLTPNGEVPTDPLTWRERQAFGRVLATVRRGGYASFSSFTLTQGIWGDFPDIAGDPFPATMLDRDKDIIVKMTYEEEFGQLRTVSGPRFTESANPDFNEDTRYDDTLTKYFYPGPRTLLTRIEYPTPFLPDGSQGLPVVKSFTKPDPANPLIEIPAYDDRGRPQRTTNPVGVVTEYSYFDDQNELSLGYLQQTVVDPGGLDITTEYEMDDLGRVIKVHLPRSVEAPGDPTRFVMETVYNELDQVVETISSAPFRFRTRNFYDHNGKLERVERELKDENGNEILGGLEVQAFCYDEEFNLVKETIGGVDLSAHLVTKHCYDSAGQRVTTILPAGNKLRIKYDERMLPVKETAGAGSDEAATTRTDYDGDGRVVRSFDARGNPTRYKFDTFGRVIEEEDALGHLTLMTYDKAGNVTCIRVFEKRNDGYYLLSRSETEYDELNRAIRNGVNRFTEPPADPTTPLGPFQRNEIETKYLEFPFPGTLLVTETFYDAQGRVEKMVDSHPNRRVTTYEYDKLDRVILVTDPLGNETRNQYDAHGNLIRTDQVDLVLNAAGNPTGQQRAFASSATFDELDRIISSTDSLGNVIRFFYDSRGNMVRQVDPLGNVSFTEYDVYNRRTAAARELTDTGLGGGALIATSTTRFEYDVNGNLTVVIDAEGRRTRYRYDALDRRRAIIYPDESAMLFDYDADGNLIRRRDNNGLQRLYTVDALGRTTRVDVDKSGLPANMQAEIRGATFEQYGYDGLDRQIRAENDFARCDVKYNSLGWPLSETLTFITNNALVTTPLTVSRDFDDVGDVTGLTYPNGRRLSLGRDDLDRLVRIQNLDNGTAYPGDPGTPNNYDIARMEYAGRQRLRCSFFNGASTTYAHDRKARLIEIDHAGPAGPLLKIQYLFDAVGNARVRHDISPALTEREKFAYDSLYRLTNEGVEAQAPFAPANFAPASAPLPAPIPNRQSDIDNEIGSLILPATPNTYDYDLVGNREMERNGKLLDYDANDLDQYKEITDQNTGTVTTFQYDDNGNLKEDRQRHYYYDSLNRLVAVKDLASDTLIAQFFHDARGRRVLEFQGGETTHLVHDGGNVIAEYQAAGGPFAHYVHDDGVDRPLQIAAEGAEYWYHADLVGSIRVLSNIIGTVIAEYRYAPFGAFIVGTNDGGNLNPWRYTARRLDELLGSYDYRARQYNPTSGRFLQRDPAEMTDGTNLYLYALNNILGANDPSGTGREEQNRWHLTQLSRNWSADEQEDAEWLLDQWFALEEMGLSKGEIENELFSYLETNYEEFLRQGNIANQEYWKGKSPGFANAWGRQNEDWFAHAYSHGNEELKWLRLDLAMSRRNSTPAYSVYKAYFQYRRRFHQLEEMQAQAIVGLLAPGVTAGLGGALKTSRFLGRASRAVGARISRLRSSSLYKDTKGSVSFGVIFHGNDSRSPGWHALYAIRDSETDRVLHFGETGRDIHSRVAEWQEKIRVLYGRETYPEPLGAVKGKATAKALETKYIRTYEKIRGHKPGFYDDSGNFVQTQLNYH